MRDASPLRRIFGTAAIINAAALLGLVAALFGDGLWDVAAWAGLAAPMLVTARAYRRRGSRA